MLAEKTARTPSTRIAQAANHDMAPTALNSMLGACGTRLTFQRGQEIMAEGADAESCYQVLSGSIRLVKLMADGGRQVCEFLVGGDFFGLEAGAQHYFTGEAVSQAVVVRYPRRQVETLIATHPAVAQYVQRLTASGLQRAYERMVLICHRSAHERIAWFLLEMAKRSPASDSVELPMTRSDIADYLGLVIETVSRVLTHLKHSGAIAIRNVNRIILLDRSALEAVRGNA